MIELTEASEMKKSRFIHLVLVLLVFIASRGVSAEQKYNPYTGHWETVSPNAELNYNPYSRKYEYSPKDSSPTYNPYE